MLYKELKEKDERGLKYSEGHDSGGGKSYSNGFIQTKRRWIS